MRPELDYAGGRRGWAGDSPPLLLDRRRIRSLASAPTLSIREATRRTLDWLDANAGVIAEGEPG